MQVILLEPWANMGEVYHEYGLSCHTRLYFIIKYYVVILGVANKGFRSLTISDLLKENRIFYDVKGVFWGNLDEKI